MTSQAMQNNRQSSFLESVLKHPGLLLLTALVLIVGCAVGLKNFSIVSDYEVFFDGSNQRLQAHKQLELEYGRKDAVRIGVEPTSGSVFDPRILGIIEELTDAAWQIPHSNRVESLTNFQYFRNSDGELVTSNLFDSSEALSADEILLRRKYATSDPSVLHLYVNPEGTIAGLQALITLPEKNSKATARIADFTRQMLNEFSVEYPDVNFYLTGSILTNDAFFSASTLGTAKLLLMMLVVGLLLLTVFLRTISVALIGLLLVIGSTLIGLGVAGWLHLPFTAFSSTALILIVAVVIASSVHILSQFLFEYSDKPKQEALLIALSENWKPIALTSLTTAVGLLCLNLSDIPPSRYLGTTSALAVIGSLVLNFTLLPAMLLLLPIKPKSVEAREDVRKFWNHLGKLIQRNKAMVVTFTAIVCVGTSGFVVKNTINDSVLAYFDSSVKFRSDSDHLMHNLFYFYSMDLSIPSGEENGVNNPGYMRKVDQLVAWSKTQPEVYSVISYTNILKNLNRAIHDGDQSYYRLPEDKNVAAEYMLMYEMSVPYGMDLNNQINVEHSAAKIIIGFKDVKGDALIAFDKKVKVWMSDNFPPVMQAVPTGPSLMFANIWGDAAKSNLKGMAIAVLAISIIIALGLRSVSLGLLCLLLNILPAIMAFGVWGLIDGRIDMGASVVAIIAFGIVVDDSIHIISKFRYAMTTLGYAAEEAVLYTLRTVGHAISISTTVLVSGFAILASSSFALNSKVGFLTCILLTFALLLDIFLLPILLTKIYSKDNKSSVLLEAGTLHPLGRDVGEQAVKART